MRTLLIPAERWRDCLPCLAKEGVVAMPTDTVYGVAGLAHSREAIDRIYEAKGRPSEKALPILVSGTPAAAEVGRLTPRIQRLIAAFWPGALTIVVQAAHGFDSPALNEDGTVALRMPADALALDIIAAAGGKLAVTSANLSGALPATSAASVLEQLDGRIDAVVDGGPSRGGTASTVVRIAGGRLDVLRPGAITRQMLLAALRPSSLLAERAPKRIL